MPSLLSLNIALVFLKVKDMLLQQTFSFLALQTSLDFMDLMIFGLLWTS